jgi:hypothetical protein
MKIERITWVSASGRQVSKDVSLDAELTPLGPVLDARAEAEGKRPRFGFHPAAWQEFRRQCELAEEDYKRTGVGELSPEAIELSLRLQASRKIHVFAERLADGRVRFEVCADESVPQEIVEDFGRLLEIAMHLQPGFILAPEARDRLRELVRERFPKGNIDRLTAALWEVLLQPAAWEAVERGERAAYLNASVYRARNDLPAHRGPDPSFQIEEPAPDCRAEPDHLARLIERERATELMAALDPRPGERHMLELIAGGDADTLTEAGKVAGLPDSHRVNIIQKAKKRRPPTGR